MRIAVAGGTGVVGRYAVAAAEGAGHEVTVLSRRRGVDVLRSQELAGALAGVDVIIDTLNPSSLSRAKAQSFFREAARRLQDAGAHVGVRHLVTLSIVGVDRVPGFGYYQAKLAHEQATNDGPVPATILRTTQFHEFAGQLLMRTRKGPLALVPRMRSQPVAARTVGEHLARLAEARPGGTHELAGPGVHDMPDLARRLLAARNVHALVVPVTLPGSRPMREGALLATEGTEIAGPTFDEWLASDDAQGSSL